MINSSATYKHLIPWTKQKVKEDGASQRVKEWFIISHAEVNVPYLSYFTELKCWPEHFHCNLSLVCWDISVWTTAAAEQRQTSAAGFTGEALNSLSAACCLQKVTCTQTESVPAASLAVSSRMGVWTLCCRFPAASGSDEVEAVWAAWTICYIKTVKVLIPIRRYAMTLPKGRPLSITEVMLTQ